MPVSPPFRPVLATALVLVLGAFASAQDPAAVTAAYHAAFEAQDEDALVELWRANPGLVLPVIDADLEGALRAIEASDAPDLSLVEKLRERALFGARAEQRASGHPILLDYASAFVGWTPEQQRQFREGQAAFGRARVAASQGEHESAAAEARACLAAAEPLGDWWGTAMGRSALGSALLAQGEPEAALAELSTARLIYHDLGLRGSEYGSLVQMVEALVALERGPRARVVTRQAIELAREVGDAAGLERLEARLAQIEADDR